MPAARMPDDFLRQIREVVRTKQTPSPERNPMGQPSKVRSLAAWILTGLLSLLFIASASGKLMQAGPVVKGFTEFGLGDYLLLIGVGELVSAVLFLIPRTDSLGLLLLSAYMGGA